MPSQPPSSGSASALAPVIRMPIEWTDLLIRGGGNPPRPRPNLANCLIAFRHAPEWSGVLVWDGFAHRLRIAARTPWGAQPGHVWGDADDGRAAEWLQYNGIDVPSRLAAEAVMIAAREHTVNPLVEWLNESEWDNTPRIHDWLTWYLGVDDTPYSRMVGRAWLLSAVARAYNPGCKADNCLILEGAQGLQKSTALATLAGPELFSEFTAGDVTSKDAQLLCSGVWIIEFSELEGIASPAKIEAIKGFLSRAEDRYRPPYSRHVVTVPRQCVFAATTNRDHYLHDDSGNRRYWPVECNRIDIPGLRRDREQLWAEAVREFLNGAEWWLEGASEDLARAEQSRRLGYDTWYDSVIDFIAAKDSGVSTAEIFQRALGKDAKDCTRGDQMRIASCLKMAGWELYRTGGEGRRRWRKVRVRDLRDC